MLASNAWKVVELAVMGIGNAREANDTLPIPQGTVVWMTFAGYNVPAYTGTAIPPGTTVGNATNDDMTPADGSIPFYLFQYTLPLDVTIPPHDHRDNFSGGFAFAVFHPGTGIPQMPWAI